MPFTDTERLDWILKTSIAGPSELLRKLTYSASMATPNTDPASIYSRPVIDWAMEFDKAADERRERSRKAELGATLMRFRDLPAEDVHGEVDRVFPRTSEP